MNRFCSAIFVLSFLLLLNTGCNKLKKAVPESVITGEAVIAADESLKPFLDSEIDIFEGIYSSSRISCNYAAEFNAVKMILDEHVRLAIVARPFLSSETEYFRSRSMLPESILLGYDAIAVITNSSNRLKALSKAELSKILKGEIQVWENLQTTGQKGEIRIVFDDKSSGIIRSLNDSLQLGNSVSGNIYFAGSSNRVIEEVSANPDALGLVGFSWLSETDNPRVQALLSSLNVVAVSSSEVADSTKSFYPTQANLYNFRYPLMRGVYALFNDPKKTPAHGFLSFLTSERGQRLMYRMGLKPTNDFQRLINIRVND